MTRLMCSKRREEVESAKSELFRVGIRSEVRSNPVAAALRVSRFELWVENESDFLKASKLCSKMGRGGRNGNGTAFQGESGETYIDIDELPAPESSGNGHSDTEVAADDAPGGALEEASLLLEQEIEKLLERENELETQCSKLQARVDELTESLSQAGESAEKQASDFAETRSSLEGEIANRKRAQERLERELRELQARVKSSEEAASEKQRKLDLATGQLQGQVAAVVELRKEIVAREQEWEEARKLTSKARAELEVERGARVVAEEKAVQLALSHKALERQLAEQKDMQQQMRAYVASLNTLRTKLQAKKTGTRVIAG